jgi:S1-C subfamily serine protease
MIGPSALFPVPSLRPPRLARAVAGLAGLALLLTGCQGALPGITASAARAASATPAPSTSAPASPTATTVPSTPATTPAASPTVVAATAPAPSAASAATSGNPIPIPGSGAGVIAEVAQKDRPGVVQITNEQFSLSPITGQALVPQGVGSGVIIDQQGHILTNNHVVANAQSLRVSLPDGRTFPATLVGRDPRTDLAVIQIHGTNLPVLPLGDSKKLVIGQWVVAIGNALALQGGPTVTAGVVSALNRTVQEPPQSNGAAGPFLFDVIQTDAPINPGNSGGPLVNLDGQVVGINTLAAVQAEPGVQAQAIGFAIGIDVARPIAQELIQTGHVTYPYIGVNVYPNSPAIAAQYNLPDKPGMIVTGLDPTGPAAKAGVRVNDVITAAGGRALNDPSALYRVLESEKPGDRLPLTIARGSQTLTITITLGTAPPGS